MLDIIFVAARLCCMHIALSILFLVFGALTRASSIEKMISEITYKVPVIEDPAHWKSLAQLCLLDELNVFQIEDSIGRKISKAIEKKEIRILKKINFEIKNYASLKEPRFLNSIAIFDWNTEDGSALFTNRLKKFSRIEFVELRIKDYEIANEARGKAPREVSSITAKLILDIRAFDLKNKRVQDRAELTAQFAKTNSDWTLLSVKAILGETLVQQKKPAYSLVKAEYSVKKLRTQIHEAPMLPLDLGKDSFSVIESGDVTLNAKAVARADFNYAMGIETGDLNQDGAVDFAIANVNVLEFSRINSACTHQKGKEVFGNQNRGVRIYLGDPKDKFHFTEASELSYTGEGVGSVKFLDYDHDGWLDIYVANGLWSAKKDAQNFGAFFVAAKRMTRMLPLKILNAEKAIGFYDVLHEFKGEVLDYTDIKTLKFGKQRPNFAGHQRNRLYRNNHDGSFTEVAFLEAVDSEADGGGIETAGDNLILKNQAPGSPEATYPVKQIFKNHFSKH